MGPYGCHLFIMKNGLFGKQNLVQPIQALGVTQEMAFDLERSYFNSSVLYGTYFFFFSNGLTPGN
jgi:hypothetical protein